MDICPTSSFSTGFISAIAGYIDCQSQMLNTAAWQALAAPGSTLAVVLTGLLTIFIAIIGYNLLLGRRLTVRSGTLAFVKIGAMFALATSWPAYRTLVYDLVTSGPSQIVAEIGPRSGVLGADGTLAQRLDYADQALAQLSILGVGNAPADVRLPPAPFGGFDAFALGGSRILFELTAVAGLGIVRIISGLMLALGPFFIAFLLFDNTRSLFEGWVRILAGTALAGIGVAIALGLELTLLEPWLGDVIAKRMAGEDMPMIATELFVIECLFSLVVAAAFHTSLRLTRAFRLAPILDLSSGWQSASQSSHAGDRSGGLPQRGQSYGERGRAAVVANVLASSSHRELIREGLITGGESTSTNRRISITRSGDSRHTTVPVGRSFTRRSQRRVSARASRRDLNA